METVIKSLTPKIFSIFKHLNAHPEVSWKEHNTTTFIKQTFEEWDCSIQTFDDSSGLIVEVGSGKPVIGLRADIDALWQEVDGAFKANHSCGHDAHMSIAVGSFMTLVKNGLPETGTFRFIFQPAEEKGTGALSFVEKGIVDDVDFLFGMHLRPAEELENEEFAPAIRHGAARFLKGTIKGDAAHGARPHLNKNAIEIGSELIQHITNIHINPMIPHSAKMTQFESGGESHNIIPGNASFALDIRAQTNEVMEELTDKVTQIANMLADYHDVTIDLEMGANIAAAVTSDEAITIMGDAIETSVGAAKKRPPIVTNGGDDFHFYTIKKPELKATMLAIGCDLKPGLHHPKMTFNQEILPQAVNILTHTLLKAAETASKE